MTQKRYKTLESPTSNNMFCHNVLGNLLKTDIMLEYIVLHVVCSFELNNDSDSAGIAFDSGLITGELVWTSGLFICRMKC